MRGQEKEKLGFTVPFTMTEAAKLPPLRPSLFFHCLSLEPDARDRPGSPCLEPLVYSGCAKVRQFSTMLYIR